MIFLIASLVAIIYVILFLIIAFIIISIVSLIIIRVPSVNTPVSYIRKIIPDLEISSDSMVADFGCGNGTFLIEALKFNPQKCVGYEIAPVAFLSAVFRTILRNKIFIRFENFFKADISGYDVIYVYLVKGVVPRLREKFEKELKLGARFVCIGSPMPGFEPTKKIVLNGDYMAYLYKKI